MERKNFMKVTTMRNKLIYRLMIVTTLFTVSCNQVEFDPIPADQLMGQQLEATYTIAQLKSEFQKTNALFWPIPSSQIRM